MVWLRKIIVPKACDYHLNSAAIFYLLLWIQVLSQIYMKHAIILCHYNYYSVSIIIKIQQVVSELGLIHIMAVSNLFLDPESFTDAPLFQI